MAQAALSEAPSVPDQLPRPSSAEYMICHETLHFLHALSGGAGHAEHCHVPFGYHPDDGVICFKCYDGHSTYTVVQQHRFELLSELAVTAIADGYYREAVASFTASLERLYEFYLKASFAKRSVQMEEVREGWKELRNHSERQFGAFVAVWIADHNAHPRLPKKTTIECAIQ